MDILNKWDRTGKPESCDNKDLFMYPLEAGGSGEKKPMKVVRSLLTLSEGVSKQRK